VRRAVPLAVLALAAAAAPADARVIDMPGKFFVPGSISVLAGDTVTWTNSDGFDHDVLALDGSFDSGHISPGGQYSRVFSQPGHVAYRCTIHPFMAGVIDVYAFQLRGPARPVTSGAPFNLVGIAPAGTPLVRIEARRADGSWEAVTTAVPRADGFFKARVVPNRPTVYRAVAAAGPSEPLALKVGAQLDTTVKRLRGGRYAIRATAKPAQAGAPAALQLYSRERFRWRQVAHATVDQSSRVSFNVGVRERYAARVVLLRGKGGYGASVGKTVHVGGHGGQKARRKAPAPPHGHHHHEM
jgi:plastocyanin